MFHVYDVNANLLSDSIKDIEEAKKKEGAFYVYMAGKLVWKQEFQYQD